MAREIKAVPSIATLKLFRALGPEELCHVLGWELEANYWNLSYALFAERSLPNIYGVRIPHRQEFSTGKKIAEIVSPLNIEVLAGSSDVNWYHCALEFK